MVVRLCAMLVLTQVPSVVKAKPVTAVLAEKFGGRWKWEGNGTWTCNDKKRHASKVCMCFPSDDCHCSGAIFVYGGDGPPVRLFG
jgi:hypothetical protein